MRRLLDSLEQFAVDVILERRAGKRAGILRAILKVISFLYLGIVTLRIRAYSSHLLCRHQIGCPVVSVGNLTVGGTGKTLWARSLPGSGCVGGRCAPSRLQDSRG